MYQGGRESGGRTTMPNWVGVKKGTTQQAFLVVGKSGERKTVTEKAQPD